MLEFQLILAIIRPTEAMHGTFQHPKWIWIHYRKSCIECYSLDCGRSIREYRRQLTHLKIKLAELTIDDIIVFN